MFPTEHISRPLAWNYTLAVSISLASIQTPQTRSPYTKCRANMQTKIKWLWTTINIITFRNDDIIPTSSRATLAMKIFVKQQQKIIISLEKGLNWPQTSCQFFATFYFSPIRPKQKTQFNSISSCSQFFHVLPLWMESFFCHRSFRSRNVVWKLKTNSMEICVRIRKFRAMWITTRNGYARREICVKGNTQPILRNSERNIGFSFGRYYVFEFVSNYIASLTNIMWMCIAHNFSVSICCCLNFASSASIQWTKREGRESGLTYANYWRKCREQNRTNKYFNPKDEMHMICALNQAMEEKL